MIALVAATLGACSSEDNEPVPQQPATQQPSTQQKAARPLTITVSETPFINPNDQSGSRGTRAAITTTSTLAEFKMDYVYEWGGSISTNGTALEASKNGEGKWVMTKGVWPYDVYEQTVNWYAYTNNDYGSLAFNMGDNINDAYVKLSVADDNFSSSEDLLVAKTSDSWNNCEGHLSLTFDHACAALRFWMKKATNLSDYTLTVDSVVLHNVVKVGDYYFDSGTWSLGAVNLKNPDYTLFPSKPGSATLKVDEFTAMDTSDAPYLFLIPQTLTPWNPESTFSNTCLRITCTITKAGFSYSGKAYIPFGATIAQGTQYDNVNINIGKNSLYKIVEGVAYKIIP